MNLRKFYSDTSPQLWKKVLGEDLHYHVGWGNGDIMYNAVQHLYQFIQPNSKLLDCGCGWGGPSKVIQRDLHCDIISVTNSEVQCEYIKNNIPINVLYKDLHNYYPQTFFDTSFFIESFCHLENPFKVLENISKYSNQIILRDYHLKTKYEDCKKYLDKWLMKIYSKETIVEIFNQHNFCLIYFEEHYKDALEPTLEYWLNNLKQIKKEEKTHHIRTLEISSKYLKNNLNDVLNGIGLATFVFEKQ
jgi:cyclopropane fatty-acyl-phospholipid synthase-like methyltransferase